MIKRIISTLLLWAIVFMAVFYGGSVAFCLLFLLLSALCLVELADMFERCGFKVLKVFSQVANFLILSTPIVLYYLGLDFTLSGLVIFGVCVFILVCMTLTSPFSDYFGKTIIPTILAILFVSFFAHWIILITLKFSMGGFTGVVFAIWAIASAKFTDVGGYAVGCVFGRHKLSPSISPNKSWEGLIGGLLSSMAVSVLIVWCLGKHLPDYFTPTCAALASIPLGLAGLVSDLFESVLKRRANVKDSGRIIPGIGGALDLADSMLLSAPLAFLILFTIGSFN